MYLKPYMKEGWGISPAASTVNVNEMVNGICDLVIGL